MLLGCGGPPDACYQPPLPSNPASLPGQLQLPLIYHAGHTCGRLALGAGQLHGEHLTHSSERMARAHESCPPLRWAPAPRQPQVEEVPCQASAPSLPAPQTWDRPSLAPLRRGNSGSMAVHLLRTGTPKASEHRDERYFLHQQLPSNCGAWQGHLHGRRAGQSKRKPLAQGHRNLAMMAKTNSAISIM